MYCLKRFLGPRFDRINSIINHHLLQLDNNIILIASTSYPFPEVLQALSYPMDAVGTEGIRGARFFPGSSPVDDTEDYAESCFRRLLGLDNEYDVSIQPHSGTQANQVVFNAVLKEDDVVLSMNPSHGGHISHTVLIGRRNPVIHYGTTRGGSVDYDKLEELASKHHPRLIIAGTSSYPREIDYVKIAAIAENVGAYLHADISHTALFYMAGTYTNLFPAADFATFNMVKNLRGPSGGVVVYKHTHRKKVGRALFPGTQGGPLSYVLLAKAVAAHRLLQMDLPQYARRIIDNARRMGSSIQSAGFPLVTNGTDAHFFLVDLRGKGVSGREIEENLERYEILVNRNLVPDDPKSPLATSGVRIGSTCVTILDYEEEDIDELADIVCSVLSERTEGVETRVRRLVHKYHAGISGASAATRSVES